MWKKLSRSLQAKFMLLVAALLFLQVVFSILFFRYAFNRQVEDASYNSLGALLVQTQETLEGAFSMVENTITYFYTSETLRSWRESAAYTPDDASVVTANLALGAALEHSILTNSAWQNDLLDSAWFFVNEHCHCFYSKGHHSLAVLTKQYKDVFRQMREVEPDKTVIFPPMDQETVFYIGQRCALSRESCDTCCLIVSVDETVFLDKFAGLLSYEGAQVYLADRDGIIYSTADSAMLGQKLPAEIHQALISAGEDPQEIRIAGVPYYASSRQVSETGLYLIAGIPRSSLLATGRLMTAHYIMIMLVFFAVFMAASILLAYCSTSFIKTISRSLSCIRSGNYRTRMPHYQSTELSELSDTFNSMADQISHLINEVYEKQLAVNQANIKYLQSQINPHFLFNTLAAISVKAKLAKEESIYKMITALSTLLGASFQFDEERCISVMEELEYVNHYLYIQKERYGDRLEYQVDVESSDLLQAQIPRLCVEPIVENAVVHGLECHRGVGSVRVQVSSGNGELVFAVSDNGTGFPEGVSRVEDLPEESGGRKRVGLRNTHQRLKLLYGERYGVFLENGASAGVCVRICVPLKMEEPD